MKRSDQPAMLHPIRICLTCPPVIQSNGAAEDRQRNGLPAGLPRLSSKLAAVNALQGRSAPQHRSALANYAISISLMSAPQIQDWHKRLLIGLSNFQKNVYPQKQAEYQRLVREGQRPHTLFITCADSRIDPELLTQSGPGEIFVSRNIGNLVPAYGELVGGVSALVEYSVAALQVDQVVVCGHTDCGAMKALVHPEHVEKLPTVKRWLRNAEAALSTVQARGKTNDEASTLEELIEENVLLQMSHLRTHPTIAGRLAQKSLAIYGWVYDIGHGQVRMFDDQQQRFLTFDGSDPELQASSGIS